MQNQPKGAGNPFISDGEEESPGHSPSRSPQKTIVRTETFKSEIFEEPLSRLNSKRAVEHLKVRPKQPETTKTPANLTPLPSQRPIPVEQLSALREDEEYVNVEVSVDADESVPPNPKDAGTQDSLLNFNIKLVVIGDSGVGKSTLLYRFKNDGFLENTQATIGIDLLKHETRVGNTEVFVQLWDTAGQEKYRGMVSSYYKSCHAVLFVYDITNRASFQHLTNWLAEARTYCDHDVSFMIVGNKSDLEYERRVALKEANSFASKMGVSYMEVSAKNNEDGKVHLAINKLVERAVRINQRAYRLKKAKAFNEAQEAAEKLRVPEYNERLLLEVAKEKKEQLSQRTCCF